MLARNQKRKLRPILRTIIFILLGSLFIFGICFGVYTWKKHMITILSPMGSIAALQKKNDTSSLAMRITDALQNHKVDYTNVTVEDNGTATIILKNKAKVIVSTQKDIESQIASLQLTIANLTIEGKQFQRLDFRFDRPVVSF